jgi:hypothetical protein
MTPASPTEIRIYHITHVDNLGSVLADGMLLSDAEMILRGGPKASIGMSTIKRRRLELPVKCHPGDKVGDYVPFYFCPRSVMLYIVYRQNHPELAYRGGQDPIVHLEASLSEAIAWAEGEDRRWAFSLSNAGATYTEFRRSVEQLGQVNWDAVASDDFRDPQVKEGKQAEFLMQRSFPSRLVKRIGVRSNSVGERVLGILEVSSERPLVEVRPDWYF